MKLFLVNVWVAEDGSVDPTISKVDELAEIFLGAKPSSLQHVCTPDLHLQSDSAEKFDISPTDNNGSSTPPSAVA
jgi:hypothetical protein